MSEADSFRELAQLCFRLARSNVNHAIDTEQLEMWGHDLAAKAVQIERRERTDAKKPRSDAQDGSC